MGVREGVGVIVSSAVAWRLRRGLGIMDEFVEGSTATVLVVEFVVGGEVSCCVVALFCVVVGQNIFV